MRYGIVIYSKHTGEHRCLGSTFSTFEEWQAYVDKNICARCYRVERVHVPDGASWQNSRVGFRKDTQT